MTYIITLELETDAPPEAMENSSNLSLEVARMGMVWKTSITNFNLFKVDKEGDEGKAIKSMPKAIDSSSGMSPFNMLMHMGMNITGDTD